MVDFCLKTKKIFKIFLSLSDVAVNKALRVAKFSGNSEPLYKLFSQNYKNKTKIKSKAYLNTGYSIRLADLL